ncbi:hypothetical protein QN277_028339 [Acacia crassicarpa]|uniref:Aluminum-activated malate transporter n=1 Tax=Acacia crassicarpa TaxID=499986 RepID=A0AAE1K0P8_9FABA|nr:hypothetical protein QN277_028339 [Acacia crassicarpa]
MNAKEGSIEITIPTSTKSGKKCESRELCKAWAQNVWNMCKEDKGKAIFGVKVGVAAILVSSLVLFEATYQVLGTNTIWAILTSILVFEYTVGATFNRGFNRALGSLLAGILAVAVAGTALSCGHVAEPIIIGFSIFMIAAVTSFMKTWPWLEQYEYGFRVVLVTYCVIITSGYRMGNPIKAVVNRLYSMVIGGIISVLVNVIVFPIWAGELLHKQLVINFDAVADSLEECVKKYLQEDGRCEHSRFTTAVMDEFPDEPAYTRCRNTLISGSNLETLANSAKWEPPHGRFLHLFYPWSEYENVGAALRYCAYEVMALHSILHSQIQAPYNLRITLGSEIQEVTEQAAELVRELGRDINNMKWCVKSSLIKMLHNSTERLQRSTELHAYILTSTLESKPSTVSKLSHALSMSSSLSSTNVSAVVSGESTELDPQKNSIMQAQNNGGGVSPPAQQKESDHEMMRRQLRRIYSWPSIEVDAFDGDYGTTSDFFPRMRPLESTAALSLTNFTSTLVEFVARLDHLIQAVDKLSKMAKFKHETL